MPILLSFVLCDGDYSRKNLKRNAAFLLSIGIADDKPELVIKDNKNTLPIQVVIADEGFNFY